jgi:hypothetical protein
VGAPGRVQLERGRAPAGAAAPVTADLADRIAIIDEGRARALDTPSRLTRALPAAAQIRFTAPQRALADELMRLPE